MVFSSVVFLFAFLPVFLAGYYATPDRFKNGWALLGSAAFYAYGAPIFVYLLVGSAAVDWWLSHRITQSRTPRGRRLWLWLSLLQNLGLLGYFKYANFFVAQANRALVELGAEPMPWVDVALPIGISFFVFQKISYTADVYRGTSEPARNLLDCVLYVALFPQLIAGPIVRYHDIDRQLRHRAHSAERFWSGVERFTLGLFKKAVIANGMAALADPVYGQPLAAVATEHAWIAITAYYFQIYFDFSGYSDMAIGLGRMMGFTFLENFDRPYLARTFTEFWRRWHISLSNFMREYVYIPLGGNRRSPARAYANLWIVFLLSGLWHGADWTFVIWGAWQGVFLTLDKLFLLRLAERVPDLLLRLVMVPAVMLSWVVFRADDLPHALGMLARLFGGGPIAADSPLSHELPWDNTSRFLLLLAAVLCFLPWSRRYREGERRVDAWSRGPGQWARLLVVWAGLLVALLAVTGSQHNPFIYFRF